MTPCPDMTPLQPVDIHTHRPPSGPADLLSAGIHPWDTTLVTPADIAALESRIIAEPRIAAIGECGLDPLRGAPVARQIEILEQQLLMAERLGMPVILHVVRAWSEIIALRRRLGAQQPWAIHGFRGNPQLARQLLRAGFHISLGPKHNPLTAAFIPFDRLLIETDDDPSAGIDRLAAALPHYDPATSLRFLRLDPAAIAPASRPRLVSQI